METETSTERILKELRYSPKHVERLQEIALQHGIDWNEYVLALYSEVKWYQTISCSSVSE